MQLTISDELLPTLPQNAHFVLDFDHSCSRENPACDCCGISQYRLVAVSNVPEAFDLEISSNIGPIYFQSWAKFYLDQKMTLRKENAILNLVGESGVIASNILIDDETQAFA
ncbi:MAG: iron-sulfur cluster biosynthesis family protein [Streptococcaceae bacterium]|jgi:uncharacterized protein YqkB|nr:iron-sulfur cluster biosynthesis family protein [Streptococcaceae bacterium]